MTLKIEKTEELKAEVKYFVLKAGFLSFRIPRARLETIKAKLDKLQKQRKPKDTVENKGKEIILNALKFDKHAAFNLSLYHQDPPALQEVVEAMRESLYNEMKFKDNSDGQTKLETEPDKFSPEDRQIIEKVAKKAPALLSGTKDGKTPKRTCVKCKKRSRTCRETNEGILCVSCQRA